MDLEKSLPPSSIQKEKEISNEELQVYDRQRFIGVEVQKRLLNARVLITPANGINTELAKNLILCGTNISIADNEIVSQDDVETNFLIGPQDLGKIRGEVVKTKLNDMNPMVHIELFPTFRVKEFLQNLDQEGEKQNNFNSSFLSNYQIVAASTPLFSEMELLDQLSHRLNIPVYNQVCAGFYGFFYVTLGSAFECILQKPVVQKMKVVNGKFVKQGQEFEYYHKATIKSSSFSTIDAANPKGAKPVFYAIKMMKKAEEQGLVYDPYSLNEENVEVLHKIVDLAIQNIKTDQDREFFTDFARLYGIEHCPVYSVVGSVASQEFIKVIAKDKLPALNWFVYDSQVGYGKIETTNEKLNATYQDLPHLTRKIENSE